MRPTTTTIEDIKLLVAHRLDVTEFLDILGWTMYELVEQLDPKIFDDYAEDILEACGEQ